MMRDPIKRMTPVIRKSPRVNITGNLYCIAMSFSRNRTYAKFVVKFWEFQGGQVDWHKLTEYTISTEQWNINCQSFIKKYLKLCTKIGYVKRKGGIERNLNISPKLIKPYSILTRDTLADSSLIGQRLLIESSSFARNYKFASSNTTQKNVVLEEFSNCFETEAVRKVRKIFNHFK